MTADPPHDKQEPSGSNRLWALVDAGIFVSSELRLDAVLDRIVAIACQIVGARYGALGVINDERTGLSQFIFRGISEAERERIGDLPAGRGILGALISDPRPIRLTDLASDARSAGFPPNHPAMKTFLGVPVTSKGRVFGNLYLTEKEDGESFTEVDEELAVALAAQAGIAIENARLFEEARMNEARATRRLGELEGVQEIGAALLGELDPTRVLRMIAQRATELVDADSAMVALHDAKAGELRVRVAVGHRAGAAEGMVVPIRGSLSGEVMRLLQPRLVRDVAQGSEMYSPMAEAMNARSAIFAPLVERGLGVGTLVVVHGEADHFGDEELFAVRRLADLGSLALQHAKLVAAEHERARFEVELAESRVREELRAETLRAVIRAQEDQQRRISRELHDSIGQSLTSILVTLKLAERAPTLEDARQRIAELREITADAATEVRGLAHELRPTVLDDFGLTSAFRRYTSDLAERSGIVVDLDLDLDDRRLEPETETVLYRVMQEATTNAVRAGNPNRISVEVVSSGGLVRLRITDDGVGFEPLDVEGKGLGLRGMQERAELVGGKLAINSSPGRGTVIELEVPESNG